MRNYDYFLGPSSEAARFAVSYAPQFQQALQLTYQYLTEVANSDRFYSIFQTSFGPSFNIEQAQALRSQWRQQNYSALPEIEVLSSELGTALGAYAKRPNKIYLSERFLSGFSGNFGAIAAVLLEEIGHAIDAQLNRIDTAGDEGAVFAALVQQKALTQTELGTIRSEDDSKILYVANKAVAVEQAEATLSLNENLDGERGLLLEPAEPPYIDDDYITLIRTRIGWKDAWDEWHAVRYARVEIRDDNGRVIGTSETDADGYLFRRINGRVAGNRVSLKVLATGTSQNVTHQINIDDTGRVAAFETSEYSVGSLPRTIAIPYDSSSLLADLDKRAFAINDAITVAKDFYKNFLVDVLETPEEDLHPLPQRIQIRRKYPLTPEGAYTIPGDYPNSPDIFKLASTIAYNWDVLLHEYAHFINVQNKWAAVVGGTHGFGISSIIAYAPPSHRYTKRSGIELAWSEGLANYLSLAIQSISQENGWASTFINEHLFNGIYQSESTRFNFEESGGVKSQGEGDELAISRILWDLADHLPGRPEQFSNGLTDRIGLGHERVIGLIEEIAQSKRINGGELSSLDAFWDALTTDPDLSKRAAIGAIFEDNGISPAPLMHAQTVFQASQQPFQFVWSRGNEARSPLASYDGEANDSFRAVIYNDDFSEVVLEKETTSLSWQLTAAEWAAIDKNQWHNFVVIGSDTREGTAGDAYSAEEITGGYWSGARRFSIGNVEGTINTRSLKSNTQLFEGIKNGLQENSALTHLPLLGDLESNQALTFLDTLQTSLTSEVGVLDDLETSERIKQAFVNGLVKAGIQLLPEDVGVVEEMDGSTRFDLSVGHEFTLASQTMAADLGLPGLGLGLSASGGLDLNVGYDFDFSIDIAKDGSIDLQTPNSEDLKLRLRAAMPTGQLSGKLGFLQVDAHPDSAAPSSVDLQLGVDIDNSSIKAVDLDGAIDINLDLETSFSGSETLPAVLSDLAIDWDWDEGNKPQIAFNNVRVDVGSFFDSFAGPLLENVQTVTQPLQPVADLLTKGVKVGGKTVNMQSLFKLSSADGTFLDSLADIARLVSLVNSIPERSPDQRLEIKLGSFNLGSADASAEGFELSQVTPTVTASAPAFLTQANGATTKEREFFYQLETGPGEGLAFPILTDRNQAFNLLLGKDADLFTYDMSPLSLGGSYESPFIPIFGPLGARIEGRVDAAADVNFGFDTHGLRKVSEGAAGQHVFDGFYVTSDSKLSLAASLNASAELNAIIARAGAGGGVTGSLALSLYEPYRNGIRDGKVHLDEFSSGTPFSKNGKITAGLHAYFKVGWGWLSYTKRFRGPQTTLINFGDTASRVVQEGPLSAPVVTKLAGISGQGEDLAYERVGNSYSNTISGGTSTDFLIGGAGSDYLIGNGGFDVASYVTASRGVTVDLILPEENTGDAYGDSYSSVEQIEGSLFDDTLRGSSANDVFDGLDGNDTLEGRAGNDTFLGSRGGDFIDGGTGSDSLSYSVSESAVRVDLQSGTNSGGFAQGDRIISIENLEGSIFNDTLSGNSSNNIIDGLAGNDVITGGAGVDTLTGGEGRDRFIIKGGGTDTITDFDLSRDLLWVEATYFSELSFVQSGSDTLMRIGISHVATLKGIRASLIGEENFANIFELEPLQPQHPYDKPGLIDF